MKRLFEEEEENDVESKMDFEPMSAPAAKKQKRSINLQNKIGKEQDGDDRSDEKMQEMPLNVEMLALPQNGCFIAVSNGIIKLRLINGFLFEMGKHATKVILNQCISQSKNNENDEKLFFIWLMNDVFDILSNTSPNQSFFGENAKIPQSFIDKYKLGDVMNDCKIFNKMNESMEYIWEHNEFAMNIFELTHFCDAFGDYLPRNRNKLLFNDNNNGNNSKYTLCQWHEKFKKGNKIDMINNVSMLKNVIVPSYEFSLKYEYCLLLRKGKQYYSCCDKMSYFHLNNSDNHLCFGKFESNVVSKSINKYVDCMAGLPYLCDIIGNYCALSDNTQSNENSQLLFDCFKKEIHNISKFNDHNHLNYAFN